MTRTVKKCARILILESGQYYFKECPLVGPQDSVKNSLGVILLIVIVMNCGLFRNNLFKLRYGLFCFLIMLPFLVNKDEYNTYSYDRQTLIGLLYNTTDSDTNNNTTDGICLC